MLIFWITLKESGLIGPQPLRKQQPQQHNPAKAKRIDDLFKELTAFEALRPSDYAREIMREEGQL